MGSFKYGLHLLIEDKLCFSLIKRVHECQLRYWTTCAYGTTMRVNHDFQFTVGLTAYDPVSATEAQTN